MIKHWLKIVATISLLTTAGWLHASVYDLKEVRISLEGNFSVTNSYKIGSTLRTSEVSGKMLKSATYTVVTSDYPTELLVPVEVSHFSID